MSISIESALDEVAVQAQGKATLLTSPVRYAVQAVLAGAFVGVAVVLMAATAGPLLASANPGTKLVQGSVFGIALTLVVFAGAELFTGANMVMLIGWLKGTVRALDAVLVNIAALLGNLVGAVVFAGVVHASGVLDAVAKKGGKPAGDGLITAIVTSKEHATDGQLFWRAALCNILVCLGLWMAARTRSHTAKLIVLFWVLFAFIASGFEHSVANMTIFALAVMHGDATWGALTHNLLFTVPGNVVGGAGVVAAGYLLSVVPKRATAQPKATPSSVLSETQEMTPIS